MWSISKILFSQGDIGVFSFKCLIRWHVLLKRLPKTYFNVSESCTDLHIQFHYFITCPLKAQRVFLPNKCDIHNITPVRKEISIKVLCGFSINPSLDILESLPLTQMGAQDTGN